MKFPRVSGHALRWKQEMDDDMSGDGITMVDAYDPFNPKGPWTAQCSCGTWEQQVRTRAEGQHWHGYHKRQVAS